MTSIEPSKIDFAELANRLLEENNVPVKRNKQTRISEWNGSVETLPAEKVKQAVQLFDTFLVENFGSVLEGTTPRELEEAEVVALADELGKAKTLAELATSVNERAKKLIFDHANKTTGTGDFNLTVPGTEMRFRRSKSGFGEPVADWDRIAEVVDKPEDLNQIVSDKYTMSLTKEEYDYLMGRVNQNFRDNVTVAFDRTVDKDAAMKYVMKSKDRERKFAKILRAGTYSEGAFYYEALPKDTK